MTYRNRNYETAETDGETAEFKMAFRATETGHGDSFFETQRINARNALTPERRSPRHR